MPPARRSDLGNIRVLALSPTTRHRDLSANAWPAVVHSFMPRLLLLLMPTAPTQEGGQEDLYPSLFLHLPGVAAVPISATELGWDLRGFGALKSVHSTLAIGKRVVPQGGCAAVLGSPIQQTGKPMCG